MLLNDFFTIQEITTTDGKTTALISINSKHQIFGGHFPDNPIVPGVTMLQMVKEILGQVQGLPLFLAKTRNAKFTAILNPEVDPIVTVNINASPLETEDGWKASGTITKEDTTYFKFAANFTRP